MDFLHKIIDYYGLTENEYKTLIKDVSEEDIPSYNQFKGIDKITTRIKKAIATKEKIFIYGDYDCDGIMSTTIIVKALKQMNADVGYYIPSRYMDGYGLNTAKVQEAFDKGYHLIITVDNGLSQIEAVDLANNLGIDVIVTDHHEQTKDLPKAYAIMHPMLSEYGPVYCCGAYVSFCLSWALLGHIDDYLLSLAGIATISDMMSLTAYNRDLVKLALKNMNQHHYYPIMKLVGDEIITEDTIGMKIAPKVNAVGRLQEDISVNRLVRFFLYENQSDVDKIACWIETINEERKAVTKVASETLIFDHDKPAIICVGDFKEGVIGLIANKLMQENHKPTIVFTTSIEDHNLLKGSARSMNGFYIAESFKALSSLLDVYGGHALAGGLSLKKDNLEDFKNEFYLLAQEHPFVKEEPKSIEISLCDVTLDNLALVDQLRPYGMDFAKPVFLIKDLVVNELAYTANLQHLSKKISMNARLLGFNMPRNEIEKFKYLAIYGNLEANIFNNFKSVVFKIIDFEGK